MAVLRRRGERRSTVVVFTSDNGLLAGEHGGLVGKDLPYPASTRVPLLVRWPGRLPAGRTRRDPVTNVDVATMLFRLGGARRPTDGRSLLARPARDTLFLESFGALDNDRRMALPPWRSVRTAGYQFTEYYDDGEVSFREYYDLRRDPWQLENAAATLSPARTASLARRLARLARCERRACP
jgi:arylsulfatase A-like enzyme